MFTYQEINRPTQRKFARFTWFSYDIDFRRKAAGNVSLNWGERHIQSYEVYRANQILLLYLWKWGSLFLWVLPFRP